MPLCEHSLADMVLTDVRPSYPSILNVLNTTREAHSVSTSILSLLVHVQLTYLRYEVQCIIMVNIG